MSDTENLSDSSSATTIENVPFESVVSNLKAAAKDAMETEDYLSYSTIIDMYLGEPTRYSIEEREALLDELLKILQAHKKITYEIGWDLPSILILYIEANWDFVGTLRAAPCVYKVLKLFECLAINGNAKELFLKGCELLGSININDVKSTDAEDAKVKFFDLKVYSLVEMINSNLKAIKTLYPSRFLSMFLASLINLIYNNYRARYHDPMFLLKRIYGVCRNYSAPPTPTDTAEYTPAELDTIRKDEEYLQRKLLTSFVTNVMSDITCWTNLQMSVDLFAEISQKEREDSNKLVVIDRLAELCLSYDISLSSEFKRFITSSHALFHTIKFDDKLDDDELVGQVFEKITVGYQLNVITSMTDSDSKEIKNSAIGSLIYYTRLCSNPVDFEALSITFTDALVVTLRLLIPSMVDTTFAHKSSQDVAVFWSWFALHKAILDEKALELELAGIPRLLLTTYLQVLLFICISNPEIENKDFRFVTLTLLTKILALNPEDLTFNFIRDSLTHCPFINIQAALIGIMKELLTKDKVNESELAGEVNKLGIDSSTAPPLPQRETPKKLKFLTLTQERLDIIFNLTSETIGKTFPELEQHDSDTETEDATETTKVYDLKSQYLPTMSAYLNLFVVLKKHELVVENETKLNAIVDKMSNIIGSHRKRATKANKPLEVNAVEILSITVDRIKDQ